MSHFKKIRDEEIQNFLSCYEGGQNCVYVSVIIITTYMSMREGHLAISRCAVFEELNGHPDLLSITKRSIVYNSRGSFHVQSFDLCFDVRGWVFLFSTR